MRFLTGPRRLAVTVTVVACVSALGVASGYASIAAKPISRFNHNSVANDEQSSYDRYIS